MTLIQVPGNLSLGIWLAYGCTHAKTYLTPVEVAVGHMFAEWQKIDMIINLKGHYHIF